MINDSQLHGPTAPPHPAIYVRSATDGEDQLEQRVEDARELARMNGLTVKQEDIIAEYGSGAKIDGRPGIQVILEQAAHGKISHLVTPRASYLSRDYHDLHQILVALAEVSVITGEGDNEPRGTHAVATAVFNTLR